MKQPDTSALRERLDNITPEQELEENMHELKELLQEIDDQKVALRNLLKGIRALKEELHAVHGSLMRTAQRERTAFNALNAAKDSADNIVDGINNAIVKAEQNTVIPAKISTDELAKVNQCSAKHIKAEKELLENHRTKLAKHLQESEGVWLSNRWFTILLFVYGFCIFVIILWSYYR